MTENRFVAYSPNRPGCFQGIGLSGKEILNTLSTIMFYNMDDFTQAAPAVEASLKILFAMFLISGMACEICGLIETVRVRAGNYGRTLLIWCC